MNDYQKFTYKNQWGELSAELIPSAFLQYGILLLLLGMVALFTNKPFITLIVIIIISFGAYKGITDKKLRWIFYKGKLSRDIMHDGTGGSKKKALRKVEEAVLVMDNEPPALENKNDKDIQL